MFSLPRVCARSSFSAKAAGAGFCGRAGGLVLVICVMAAAFFGCVPQAKVRPTPPVAKPADTKPPVKVVDQKPPEQLTQKELLNAANLAFKEKNPDQAFDLYTQYIQRFPDASLIPAMLMRMSRIKKSQGEIRTAKKLLGRLALDHPRSSFAADARLELLALDFDSGDYKSVFKSASALLKTDMGRIHEFKVLLMVGDTYAAMNVPADAVYYYGKALSKARGGEKRRVFTRLDQAVRLLDGETLEEMARGMADTPITTYLLFQLALNAIEEERYEKALSLLSDLVATHPDAPQAQEAERLLDSLNEMAVYHHQTVGCLLPLTGAYAAYGQRALKGIEYALSVFSARPGAPGIHIKVKDTASDDKTAVAGLMDLYDAHVAAVIGPIATVEAVVDVAQKKKMPLLTLTQKEGVAKRGEFIFRNFITPRMQVKALVNYAAGQLGISRFAVLYPDEKYGNTFMNLFWDQVMSVGGQIKGAESYDPSQTDFAESILKLVGLYYGKKDADKKPVIDFQALFIPDAPQQGGPHRAPTGVSRH